MAATESADTQTPTFPRGGSLRLRGSTRSPAVGLVVALGAVAATTALIFPLRQVTPAVSNGVLYLLAVLLVSTYWGLWLGLLTALASALAFNFFHIPPTGQITIGDPQNYVALGVFLVAAVAASTVANLARARADEAERASGGGGSRRRPGAPAPRLDGPPERARPHLASARRGARAALGSARAARGTRVTGAGSRCRSRSARDREATLLVPTTIDDATMARLRERVLPALEALLAAALDRDALQAEVVETQALRQSDTVKTALLRAISHDLRTPLTTILTASAAIGSPSLSPQELEEPERQHRRAGAAALAPRRPAPRSLAPRGRDRDAPARLVLDRRARSHGARRGRRRRSASSSRSTATSRCSSSTPRRSSGRS